MITRRLVVLVLALAAVAAAMVLLRRLGEAPSVVWQVGQANDTRSAAAYQEVGVDEPLRLTVQAGEPLYVYVVSHDREDGTLAWWPTPMLRSDSPQPTIAGATRLPGLRNGTLQGWPARPPLGVTDWIAIASRAPIADLDALLPRLRQASNTTFTDGSIVLSNPNDGLAPLGRAGQPPPHPLLAEALALPKQTSPNGRMQPARAAGVWLATLQVVARKDANGDKVRAAPLDKLKAMLPDGDDRKK